MNLIEKYFNEKKKKYNSKFYYYVDQDGNYIKEAKETKMKEIIKINCPKYFNVTGKLSAVNKTINNFETKLRYLRTALLDGKTSSVKNLIKLKKNTLEKFKERELLQDIDNFNKDQMNIDISVLEELIEKK